MNLNQLREQLQAHPRPVIVDFWAPWCRPCRASKPILEALAEEHAGRVDLWAINADEDPQLLRELQIFSIPTLLVTRRGEIIHRSSGLQSRESYRKMFEALSDETGALSVTMSAFDRFLRLFAGTAIGLVGLSSGVWLLLPLGGLIAFLGIYDRCPVWRAITSSIGRRAS